MINVAAAVFSILVVAPVAWMLMDRTPPYDREQGEIIAAPAGACGEEGAPPDIVPGGCVIVDWKIRVIRNCEPSTAHNVVRSIIDSEGVMWPLAPIRGIFGTTDAPPHGISRHIRIPSAIARGRAMYRSTATYACYPWQKWFWPIAISRPDILFDIK